MVDVEKQKQEIMDRQKNAKKKGALYLILSEVVFFLLILLFLPFGTIFALILSTLITMFPIFFLVTYYILAPQKVVGYFVEQNRYLFIEEGGAYKRPSVRCSGKKVDKDGLLVPEEESPKDSFILRIAPGYGPSSFEIHKLRFFAWFGLFEYVPMRVVKRNKYVPKKDKNSARVEYREDVAWDGWLTNVYPYGFEVTEYTKDNIPLTLKIGGFARSENPGLTAYGIEDWWTAFYTDVSAAAVELIRNTTYNEFKERKNNLGSLLFKVFHDSNIVGKAGAKDISSAEKIKTYGMVVESFQITEFSVPDDILEAAEAEAEQEYEKKAARVVAEKGKIQSTIELSAILELFLQRTCMSIEEYAQEVQDPVSFFEKYGEIWEGCKKDLMDWIAIKNGSGVRVHADGSRYGGDLVDAVAVLQRLGHNFSSSEATMGGGGEEPKKKGFVFKKGG